MYAMPEMSVHDKSLGVQHASLSSRNYSHAAQHLGPLQVLQFCTWQQCYRESCAFSVVIGNANTALKRMVPINAFCRF